MDLNDTDHNNSQVSTENNKTRPNDKFEVANSTSFRKKNDTLTLEISNQGYRSTRLSKKAVQNLAQLNAQFKNKINANSNSRSASMHNEMNSVDTAQSGVKRKNGQDNEDRTKRQRQKFQPFQSPNCQTSTPVSNPEKSIPIAQTKDKDKMVIYNFGDFLAVRNESNSFFVCRAKQNICRNGRKIKIQWYTDEKSPESFTPDYLDFIDFECIITNIRINRLEKGLVALPPQEKQRILNILERAINVEKGHSAPPDPTKVLKDGLDISMIGEIEEDEILRKIKSDANGSKKTNNAKQSNSLVNGTTCGENNEQTEDKAVKVKKEIILVKPDNKVFDNDTTEKRLARPKKRKVSSVVSATLNDSTEDAVGPSEITAIKFEDNSKFSFDDPSEEKDSMFNIKVLPFISTYANSKLLIRVVLCNDYNQLQSLLQPKCQQICSICVPRSICIKKTAIHYSLINEDFILLNRLVNVKREDLAEYPHCIPSMELYHSELSLDSHCYQNDQQIEHLNASHAKFSIKENISFDFILKSQSYFQNGIEDFISNIIVSVKSGNCRLAYLLAQKVCETKSPVFNKSHLLLLGSDFTRELEYSLLKEYTLPKHKVFPVHIAAINPDSYFFSSIINNTLDQLYASDTDGWLPIHYASVCSTFFNLQYLLNLGVSTLNYDLKGNTPLHLATSCNRLDNVALILNSELAHSSSSVSLRSYNRKGWTPLHIACKKGFVNIIKFFIENNVEIDVTTSNSSGELTSLMIASQFGHLNVAKLLIENGANGNSYDKKNRSPLTHAVMNGHASIAHFLLNFSSNPCKDMFGNNLFHYALAYGWFSCYEVILKTNVNMKDTNTLGLTPICAAFMKGHFGLIEDILKRNILGVNVPVNDSGITLAMLTFSLYPNETLLKWLKLFVEKYKCDLGKTDYNGNNALHYLLQFESKYKLENSQSIIKIVEEALSILLKNGCDPFTSNNAGICPILFSLKNNCFVSFKQFFKDHHKTVALHQILTGSEHFLFFANFHLLDIVDEETEMTFGRYFVNTYNQNKSLQNIVKSLNLKANKHGDIPIEHLIKSSRQIILSSKLPQEMAEHELVEYLDFLLHFYELKFLQDISLLHLAAQFGCSVVVNHLATKFFNIDDLNEMGNTPLTVALKNENMIAAQILIESGANVNLKIDSDLTCFLYSLSTSRPSLDFILFLSKFEINIHETDLNQNTALHLVCRMANENLSYEIIQTLIEKGIDINSQNKLGETALHVAFKSNTPSEQLGNIFEIFLRNRFNLFIKDNQGLAALNYLFMSGKVDNCLLQMIQMVDTRQYDLNTFVDKNGANLLHYAIRAGDSNSLAYLKSVIDVHKLDNQGISPLVLAAIKNKKDCALIMLQSNVEILRNSNFVSELGETINVLTKFVNNGWMDIILEILENAKKENHLIDLISLLIKSNCSDFAISVLKSSTVQMNLNRTCLKRLLEEFSLHSLVDSKQPIQANFLKVFDFEMIKELFATIFTNCLRNWNYIVCYELVHTFSLSKIMHVLHQEKKSINLISLTFWRAFKEDEFLYQMKDLVSIFLDEEISINSIASYPIVENGHFENRYAYCYDQSISNSNVQYSPLIVAVIKRDHKLVQWLLSLKHNGNFAVDINLVDSNQRTALMHSIRNNDLKMVKLLLDRNYCLTADSAYSEQGTLKNINQVDLLVRDRKRFTVFHYLILPFDSCNFSKADTIFSLLWQLLDANFRNADFINELYKLAMDNHILNIATLLEKIEPRKVSIRPISKKVINSKLIRFNFQNDYDTLLNQFFRAQKSSSICNRNILQDEQAKLPYDATFTKLDSQKGNYIYNFYKIQIILISDKHVLINRWGRVGTAGNLKKTFFNSKQDAIDEFKKIFYVKSGNAWTSINDLNMNCVPIQDKYRIVDTKRSMKVMGFNLDLHLDQLVTIKSELPIELRDLVIRWIRVQVKCVDSVRTTRYNNLNSLLLDTCDGILQKIYSLIFKQKTSLNGRRRCSLKYMNEIIDLTEEFYNQIGIYGREFDHLGPILSLTELLEKRKYLHHLKYKIFAKELLFCAQKTKEINPIDYIYDSFCYEIENISNYENEETKFTNLFFKNSIDFKCSVVAVYKIKSSGGDQFESTPGSYYLWHQLDNEALFRTFSKGLQLSPMTDPNSHLIFHGILLSNRINKNENKESDSLSYVLLCEAKLDNILQVSTNEVIDHSLVENKHAITRLDLPSKECTQHYLSWKGITIPFRQSNIDCPSIFTMLDSKYVSPRYLIEFKCN